MLGHELACCIIALGAFLGSLGGSYRCCLLLLLSISLRRTAVVEEHFMICVNLSKHKSCFSQPMSFRIAGAFLTALLAMSTSSCTSLQASKKTSTEAVEASAKPEVNPLANEDIPEELKSSLTFDPVHTLDPKVVQESDFYQIKQEIERNRAALEAAWKEQEAAEARVKEAMAAEKTRKAELAKQEEEERERQRLKDAELYEKQREMRAKYEADADKRVKKMPTITRDEELWNGLED